MSTKKRPYSIDGPAQFGGKRYKRYNNQELFESQDIWKNLDRVRKSNPNAIKPIKNSRMFVLFEEKETSKIESLMEVLHKYVDEEKVSYVSKGSVNFISLKNFSILDCCLIFSIIFTYQHKKWSQSYTTDFFKIQKDLHISGNFFLPNNCIIERNHDIYDDWPLKITESKVGKVSTFQQYRIELLKNESLTHLFKDTANFLLRIKFPKCQKQIEKHFMIALKAHYNNVSTSIMELPFIGKTLLDLSYISKLNRPLIQKTNVNIMNYIEELDKYNNPSTSSSIKPSLDSNTGQMGDSSNHSQNRTNQNMTSTNSRFSNPLQNEARKTFLSQEQIKEHCMASVKASMDVVKTKSPYQIFKTYIKCPRGACLDMIYEKLNDLRSQTNCNIVVLHLNNVSESEPWFKSLSLEKYTSILNSPHPGTIRTISIGGVSEYMIKALQLILEIISST